VTVAIALILAGVLLLWAGIKGRSLSSAIRGSSQPASSGGLLQ
jgi:hypothetical protein